MQKPKNVGVFLLLMFFSLTFVSAQGCDSSGYMGRFEPNSDITITETCPTCTFINITIRDPNSTIIIYDQAMTLDNGFFSYNISSGNYTTDGTYFIDGRSNLDNPFRACYDVLSGRNIQTGESILYFILIGLALFVFSFSLYGAIVLPFANQRNAFDKITQISIVKYMKMGLMVLTYLMLIWVMNLSISITNNIVSLTQYSGFFEMVFNISMIIFWPFFIIMFILFNVMFVKDLQLRKMINRMGSAR